MYTHFDALVTADSRPGVHFPVDANDGVRDDDVHRYAVRTLAKPLPDKGKDICPCCA